MNYKCNKLWYVCQLGIEQWKMIKTYNIKLHLFIKNFQTTLKNSE